MAKGFGARLANALAIGVGGLAQGYGKGTMEVALNAREQYQQQLKEQRAGAAAAEERVWREGESEKGREFEKEMFKERLTAEEQQQEKSLQNQLTLEKLRQSGRASSGSGPSAITRTVTDAEGKIWGLTKTGEKVDLGIQGKVTGSGGASDTVSKTVTDAEGKMWGITKSGEKIDLGIQGQVSGAKSDTVKPTDIAKAMKDEMESRNSYMHPGYKDWRKMSEEEKKKVAGAAVLGNYEASGAKVPEDFANRYRQQSEAEAPQPSSIPAPATSTQGDKPTPATPPGSGSKESPFMATTEEQQRWVIENAPPGAFVSDGTKIFRKP